MTETIEYDEEEKIYYSVTKISKDEYRFDEKRRDFTGNFITINTSKYKTISTPYRTAARDSIAKRVIRKMKLEEDGNYVNVVNSD